MPEPQEPNAVVRAIDTGWVKLGALLRLPSAQKVASAVDNVEPAPAVAEPPALQSAAAPTTIELPGGKTAQFKLLELRGEYDFNTRSSEYKSSLKVGNARLLVRHDVATNKAQFELIRPDWEVGYRHADQNLHALKRWRVGRNAVFTARQDVPQGNWALVPSPKLGLEHTLFKVAGVERQKLEMRYDTFLQRTTLLEDLRVNRWLSLSARADSATMEHGALATLTCEPRTWALDTVELQCSKAQPLGILLVSKPLRGVKLGAFIDPRKEVVTGEVKLTAARQGCMLEVHNAVSAEGWSKPRVQIGFVF